MLDCVVGFILSLLLGLLIAFVIAEFTISKQVQSAYRRGRSDERREIVAKINSFYTAVTGATQASSEKKEDSDGTTDAK